MPRGTYYFTKDFLWGSATAAHQVEGRNENNTWYAWEQEEGAHFRGWSVWAGM
jgi:beta-glucosidase